MKKHYKYIILVMIIMASLACSLPFLAGDATEAAPTEAEGTQAPTAEGEPTSEVTQSVEGVDPCLVGLWTMDVYALNNKFLDLTHSPNMYVVAPSAMSLDFKANGTYSISGETAIQADLPNSSDYMQMTGTHNGQGRYFADGTNALLSDSTYAVVFGGMSVSIDGEFAELPMSTLMPDPTFSLPDDFMAPPASTSYVCSPHTLLITYETSSGTVTEEWAR